MNAGTPSLPLPGALSAPGSHAEREPAASIEHIRFDGVGIRYGRQTALSGFDLTLHAGEALALLGPSGSGKTTALRALAGFIPIAEGHIRLHGRDISGLSPQQRGFGIVVQNYALFPHMSVADNVAFGLRARRLPRAEMRTRIEHYLELVGMRQYARRRPLDLSGGQQQRVALARALAIRPDVLLMDEPLSALDAPLRREMLGELITLHRELPDLTMLFVTHDQSEALALADRVGLLRDGELLALDVPKRLYDRPPNRFTAEFLGQTNLLAVEIPQHPDNDDMLNVCLGKQVLRVPRPDDWTGAPGPGWLCLRPHLLSLEPAAGMNNRLDSRVLGAEWKGSHYRIELEAEGQTLHVEANAALPPPAVGNRATLSFAPTAGWLLTRDA
jgi:2-aminoethylphosphonate transport system ATP-binding protein